VLHFLIKIAYQVSLTDNVLSVLVSNFCISSVKLQAGIPVLFLLLLNRSVCKTLPYQGYYLAPLLSGILLTFKSTILLFVSLYF
jgi:hypothetical protein